MSTEKIQLSIGSDLDRFQRDEETTRILEVVAAAPQPEGKTVRPKLNLALVIDRSGSMGGEKIEFARGAVAHVLDMLQDSDKAALVAYDDRIEVHSPSVALTAANRRLLKERVGMITARGTTNLFGGWQTGCEQAAEAASSDSLNRVLLLTDGLANIGLCDPEVLAMHARELARRGVSTSTFGVGLDYDHILLEGMANQGGGQYHYIENARDIHKIFEAEFKELAAAAALDVELCLQLPDEVHAEVLGGWSTERMLGKLVIRLGSLYAGRHEPVYLRLRLPAGLPETLPLKAILRARLADGSITETACQLELLAASKFEIEAAEVDKELIQRYVEVDMAEKAAEALKLERKGERERAAAFLAQSIQARQMDLSEERRREYLTLTDRLEAGLDEKDRKSIHELNYLRSKNRGR